MKQVSIKFAVSLQTALHEGRATYGEDTYTPNDTELAFLSVEERDMLAGYPHCNETFKLVTGQPPTWPNIAQAIRTYHEQLLAKQAAELAEREAKIVACLAEPDDKWLSLYTSYGQWQASCHAPGYNIPSDDDRVKARIEALQPAHLANVAEAKRRNEQAKADKEAAEAKREADKTAAEQVKADAIQNLNDWCIEHGPDHLKRAAKDEYDVVGGLVQWLAEQLQTAVGGTVIRDNTKLWGRYDWNERKSPGAKAFEVLDTVTAAVEALEHPTSVTVEVERIMLVEVEPAEDDYDASKREFTGVVVSITHPAAARRCLVVEAKA